MQKTIAFKSMGDVIDHAVIHAVLEMWALKLQQLLYIMDWTFLLPPQKLTN